MGEHVDLYVMFAGCMEFLYSWEMCLTHKRGLEKWNDDKH